MLISSSSHSRKRNLFLNLLIAIIYFIMARACLAVAFEYSNATPVWLCSGFALAVVVLWGYNVIPGIALGAFAANLVTFFVNKTSDAGTTIWVSALIAIGNTGEAFVGYFLLVKLTNIHNIFQRVKGVFHF